MGRALVTVSARADIEEDWIVTFDGDEIPSDEDLFDQVVAGDQIQLVGERVTGGEDGRSFESASPVTDDEAREILR